MTCMRIMSPWATRQTWPLGWNNSPRPARFFVTAYTHKLTDGYFEFENLGQTQIKGVEAPLQHL